MTGTQMDSFSELHSRAEEKARLDEEMALDTLTLDDARQLFHELRVYQIELEMQNEELRNTQRQLEDSRSRYFALYDRAPVGYLTLCEEGLILNANLAAATMFDTTRKNLFNKPITHLIYREDQDVYCLHRKRLFEKGDLQVWEMRMVRADGSPFWARLQAIPARNDEYWITLVDISRRKKLEVDLQENNNYINTVLMSANDGFVVIERSGKIIVWNSTAERVFGVSADEAYSRTATDHDWKMFKEDGSPLGYGEFPATRTFALGEPCLNMILKVERESGDFSWINVNTSPIFKADESVPGSVVITFSDITERKRAELVMQARLRLSDYAFKHSLHELLTKVMDEAESLTDSKIGFFHFVGADQMTIYLQTWSSNTLATHCTPQGHGQHYILENAGVWADCIRERRPLIHNNYESLPNRKGLPPGHVPVQRELVVPIIRNNLIVAVLGVGNKKNNYTVQELSDLQHLASLAWDIITRKQAEDALQESELRFRSIMDLAPNVAVQGYRIDGTTIYWNHASETLYGYSSEEAVGKSLLDLIIPPGMQEDVRKAMTWMAETGEAIPAGELVLMRKDGTRVPVYSSHALLKPVGRDMELFCIDMDLTERKLDELELRLAKEAAEAANRAKSDFLATMSHEIRTPLGAMMGNVELLEGSPLTSQQQEYLNDCKSAAQILLQVINDVLDFSKIEAGKLELVNETFSVSSMSRQLVRIFSASARQKGLDLAVSLADDLPSYISADQKRLRQIISNLLSNAIKFTTQGTVSLEIFRDHAPPEASPVDVVLHIAVRDTGIGIPNDKQEQIFESFTQVERFGTRTTTGTGLGLPICRRLLALMGGSISVSSVLGEGSVFTVLVPVTQIGALSQVHDKEQTQAEIKVPSRKILLADDDQWGRAVAQKLLQRKGYEVTAVENGADLLDALQKTAYEIVLTDISMPDMEGTQVARIIRSGEREGIDPRVPIIAMTAHAFTEDREHFLASGIDGYVAKPVNIEDLFRQIEELCSRGRG